MNKPSYKEALKSLCEKIVKNALRTRDIPPEVIVIHQQDNGKPFHRPKFLPFVKETAILLSRDKLTEKECKHRLEQILMHILREGLERKGCEPAYFDAALWDCYLFRFPSAKRWFLRHRNQKEQWHPIIGNCIEIIAKEYES